ncbi:hypothetical protein [Niastella sp. OAS944]|uniref:hypothetical protein n=1 Tax=Niastella sp. OAS944 TaxID=2664089 RepID=UPI003471FBDE|nr:hypothetical protein [Chitinophagaceae bacterium OAS944]
MMRNSDKNFETEISQLKGIDITSKVIKIANDTSFENIIALLKILRTHKVPFALYDGYYPSPSDPGAYLSYSQEQNETENAWSMTLGNHRWSGGIYTISENNIALQIHNLVRNNQIDSIEIDKVVFFSHYEKENKDKNRNKNALLYGIHSSINNINPEYLIFGFFSSDNYGPYNIFKLTNDKLFIYNSETWHSQRHSRLGYLFEGPELSKEKFNIAKELQYEIPFDLLKQNWSGFYTTDNKNEDKFILEIKTKDFHRTISIDSYDIETDELPVEIRKYRMKVQNAVRQLMEYSA